MCYINVSKIPVGPTTWGPHGLKVAKEPSLSFVISMFTFLERTSFCLKPSPAAFMLRLQLWDWTGPVISPLFVFLFHSPCYFVYLPLNYPFKESPLRALSTSPPTHNTYTRTENLLFFKSVFLSGTSTRASYRSPDLAFFFVMTNGRKSCYDKEQSRPA